MKSDFLSLHLFNQLFDPVEQAAIGGSRRYKAVMLDLPVDFYALLTHGTRLNVTGGHHQPPAIV
jgi:hypothetical protein